MFVDQSNSQLPVQSDLNVVLIRRVADALMAHDPDRFARLDVTAVGGTVMLRGRLVGEQLRDRAVSVARGTPGAAAVIDGITLIAAPAAPPAVEAVTLISAPVRDPWWQRAIVPVVLIAITAAIGVQHWSAAAEPSAREPQPVVPVEGMALVDGKPAAGATLTFHPLFAVGGVAERPTATVGRDGRFLVGTYAAADGAPVGPYVVTLEYRPRGAADDASAPPAAEPLPQAFRSRFTTPLKVNIPPDSPFVRLPTFHVAARREKGR
jgi:hypothetical protein